MTKARYSTEVLIQNGRIRRSTVPGLEHASEEQIQVIDITKPVLYSWLRSRIASSPELCNSEILVKAKYIETSSGLAIDFKVQNVHVVGQTSSG